MGRLDMRVWAALLALAGPVLGAPEAEMGPLRTCEENPRYFGRPDGAVVYLAGMHDGWELQDNAWGDLSPAVTFDWPGFLDDLEAHNLNLIRMWSVEHTKITDDDPHLTTQMPWVRVADGGLANDGLGKFDLTRFAEAYFARLRSRVRDARERGIYVSIMLFEGFSIQTKGGQTNPWPSHPLNAANNLNGVDGDTNHDDQGGEVHTWLGEDHPVTVVQRAYVRKVVETVNDLDNVLYEIANESDASSTEWQYRMVGFVRELEAAMPFQHPVGMSFQYGPGALRGTNAALFDGPADWIAPGPEAGGGYDYRGNPPPADGAKVIVSDTDHQFGVGCKDYRWAWRTFCRGLNALYMDSWTGERGDADRELVRVALGLTRRCAEKLDMNSAVPDGDRASSGYCLADASGSCVVYLPEGGEVSVDLPAAVVGFAVEWMHPRTGETTAGFDVAGGAKRVFSAPFAGDAVLCLRAR